MRLRSGIALVIGLLLALAGCAGGGIGPGQNAGAPAPTGSAPADGDVDTGALALIGLWTVADTDEEAGTVLRLAPGRQLSLWRACGTVNGSWAGAANLFIGELNGGHTTCLPKEGPPADITPSWLLRAASFRVEGANRVLLDQGGAAVARLLAGGKPKVGPNIAASEAEPPVVSDEDRAELGPAAPLPAGLTPVDRITIVGRWVPVTDGTAPHAEFRADGTWTGSDGCNGQRGRWAAGPGGAMLATGGASTLIACDGAPVPGWVAGSARAGFADGQLVLVNKAGVEVARLRKA